MVYLDNAATTRPHPSIVSHLNSLLLEEFGNPSSIHPLGIRAAKILSVSRKKLSRIFNVPQAGIVFCSSGTESDNLAIKGTLTGKKDKGKRIITTKIEHAAVLQTCEWLREKLDITIDYVDIEKKTGRVKLDHLAGLIDKDVRLVTIQHANSETGVVQDLPAISRLIRSKNPNIIIHSDGVQAFSRIPYDFKSLGVDLYSISAHKFHGLKGAGALILGRDINLQPIVHGGGQESGLRSGTENVLAISALGQAAEIACENLEENLETIAAFAGQFKTALKKQFPDCVIFEAPDTLPHIISMSIPGIPGEVLLHHLAENKIFVSTGSACNATTKKLSPVLTEYGYAKKRIMETVRISFAACEIPKNREEFIDGFLQTVKELRETL